MNIVVFICEGGSEPSFIRELLLSNYNYHKSDEKKSQEILCSSGTDDKFVLLSHPYFSGIGYGKKGGGDTSLLDTKTYLKINGLLNQNFGTDLNNPSVIYVVLTDINKKEVKKKSITDNIKKFCPKGNINIFFASKEIESWFISGIGDKFLKVYKIDEKKLKNTLKKDIENLDNTKELLDIILSPCDLNGIRNSIGEEFGKYIDINLAISKSKTFKKFIDFLNKTL